MVAYWLLIVKYFQIFSIFGIQFQFNYSLQFYLEDIQTATDQKMNAVFGFGNFRAHQLLLRLIFLTSQKEGILAYSPKNRLPCC